DDRIRQPAVAGAVVDPADAVERAAATPATGRPVAVAASGPSIDRPLPTEFNLFGKAAREAVVEADGPKRTRRVAKAGQRLLDPVAVGVVLGIGIEIPVRHDGGRAEDQDVGKALREG